MLKNWNNWRLERGNAVLQVTFTISGMTLKLEGGPADCRRTFSYTIDKEHRDEGERLADALWRVSSVPRSSIQVALSGGSYIYITDATSYGGKPPKSTPYLLLAGETGVVKVARIYLYLRFSEVRKWLDMVHDFFELNWAKSY